MEKTYCYKYPRPALTTDILVFHFDGEKLNVLLIQRGNEPYKEEWAFPGGFMNMDEDAESCARRELEEETGLKIRNIQQLHTFSAVNRDPRGRTVSIAYYAFLPPNEAQVKAGDDASKAEWFPLSQLPPLAFDHDLFLQIALERLKQQALCQPFGLHLLPHRFPLQHLQRLYECILQTSWDTHEFEKQILQTGLLLPCIYPQNENEYYKFNLKKYSIYQSEGFFLPTHLTFSSGKK